MICNKCGYENAENAKFCVGCGAVMQEAAPQTVPPAAPYAAPAAQPYLYPYPAYTPGYAAPANALPQKRRDISAKTFVLMILNAAFAFVAMLLLYIPTYWERKVQYTGTSGTKGRTYYSDISRIVKFINNVDYKKEKDFYTLLLWMIIVFSVIAVAGIVFAILRFRFSAALLLSSGMFALTMVYFRAVEYFTELFYYMNHTKEAKYRTSGAMILTPIALCFAVGTIVLSLMVYANYRKKQPEAPKATEAPEQPDAFRPVEEPESVTEAAE